MAMYVKVTRSTVDVKVGRVTHLVTIAEEDWVMKFWVGPMRKSSPAISVLAYSFNAFDAVHDVKEVMEDIYDMVHLIGPKDGPFQSSVMPDAVAKFIRGLMDDWNPKKVSNKN